MDWILTVAFRNLPTIRLEANATMQTRIATNATSRILKLLFDNDCHVQVGQIGLLKIYLNNYKIMESLLGTAVYQGNILNNNNYLCCIYLFISWPSKAVGGGCIYELSS